MFTEETIGRVDVREPAPSTLDADFAAHATAIEELYQSILTGIAEAAQAWTPEAALLEAAPSEADAPRAGRRRDDHRTEAPTEATTEAIAAPRTEAPTEAIVVAPRTEAISVQRAEAPARARGAHHAETGQMAAISMRPAVPRTVAA